MPKEPSSRRWFLPTIASIIRLSTYIRKNLAKYYPDTPPSCVSLEGFVDAMVLVEGLKRAGKDPTREKFMSGVESIHEMKVGPGSKLILAYGPADHKGFDNVYPTMVKGGQPVLLTDGPDPRNEMKSRGEGANLPLR